MEVGSSVATAADVTPHQIQQILGPSGSLQVAHKQQSRLEAGFVREA